MSSVYSCSKPRCRLSKNLAKTTVNAKLIQINSKQSTIDMDKKSLQWAAWENFRAEAFSNTDITFDGENLAVLLEQELKNLFFKYQDTIWVAKSVRNRLLGRRPRSNLVTEHLNDNKLKWPRNSCEFLFVPHIQNNSVPMLPIAREIKSVGYQVGVAPVYDWRGSVNSGLQDMMPADWNNFEWFLTGGSNCPNLTAAEERLVEQFGLSISDAARVPGFFTRYGKAQFTKNAKKFCSLLISRTNELEIFLKRIRPFGIFAARPKGPTVPMLLGAKRLNIPAYYVTHTTWFRDARVRYELYDLRLFSSAILFTKKCASYARSLNPGLKIVTTGMPQFFAAGFSDSPVIKDKSIKIGFPAGNTSAPINQLGPVTGTEKNKLLVKSHPPGSNVGRLKKFTRLKFRKNIYFVDHAEMNLFDFFENIDVLIGGMSTACLYAAACGIPVISWFSCEEQILSSEEYKINARDVAIWHAESILEVGSILSRYGSMSIQDRLELRHAQKEKAAREIPAYDLSAVFDNIDLVSAPRKRI